MGAIRLPKWLAIATLTGLVALTPANAAFSDTSGHWAEQAITKWSGQYGIINGYDDGTFRPDQSITRGAFAGILDRFLKFQDVSAASTFSDTPGTYWEDAILKLHASGVYLGNNGKALPKDTITRQQAVAMIARAFQIDGETTSLSYSDEAQVADYARGYVAEMTRRGYLNDVQDNCFRPTDPITRAEIVNILANLVETLIQNNDPYTSDVAGNLMVNAADGATLENLIISGDLIVAPGVQGVVTLDRVTIQGDIRNFSTAAEIDEVDHSTPVTPVEPDTTPEEPVTPDDTKKDDDTTTKEDDTKTDDDTKKDDTNSGDNGDSNNSNDSDDNKNNDDNKSDITPVEPENPTPEERTYPWVEPYGYINYDKYRVPLYDSVERSQVTQGDFVWNGSRLNYVGGAYETSFGIDVSAYQNRASTNNTIDWNAVRNDGVDFAMVRIALRGYGSGKLSQDAFYAQNITGAMEAGIQTGVYIFSQAISVEEAVEEADYVIKLLDGYEINGPVAFDWEMSGSNYRVYSVKPDVSTACAVAFCKRIEEAGYQPMVYIGKDVGYNRMNLPQLTDYPLWYAEYKSSASEKLYPMFYYQVDVWQFTSSCTVNGIGGKVDANIRFKR